MLLDPAARYRGLVAGLGLGAAVAGLLGMDGGLLWIIGGVWLARSVWGKPPGLAWAFACLAAGWRWGTLGLGGIQAASSALGSPVTVGPPLAVAGACALLLAAAADVASWGGVSRGSLTERAASGIGLLVLVPAFLAPGIREPSLVASLAIWVAAAAALGVATSIAGRASSRLPGWAAPVVAAAGAVAVTMRPLRRCSLFSLSRPCSHSPGRASPRSPS